MRLRPWLAAGATALALLTASACSRGTAQPAHAGSAAASPAKVSQLVVPTAAVDGIAVSEVSGLAWDAGDKLLYAVSDQGQLYRMRVRVEGDKLASIQPLAVHALRDPVTGERSPQSGKHFNAEGLDLRHAADDRVELIVAMEEDRPAIGRFSAEGTMLERLPVPAPANNPAHFAKSKKGDIKHGLEAVVMDPVRGLVTAPESPLLGQPDNLHTVYANGDAWSFPALEPGSRLKGLDVLPDGNLLVLERSRPGGSKTAQVGSLRRVDLSSCGANGVCKTTLLASLPPTAVNFEGMTLLDAHHVLLASDNGGAAATGTLFTLIVLP